VDNLKKCPPPYEKMIIKGREGQMRFVHEVGNANQEAVRTDLEKVSEDLISDDDFSRQSTQFSEEKLVSSTEYDAKTTGSIPTTKSQPSIPLVIMQKKPPPPSNASNSQSRMSMSSKASSSSANRYSEDEEKQEEEEEFEEDEEEVGSQGPSKRLSLIDREAEEETLPKRGIKRTLADEPRHPTPSTQPKKIERSQSGGQRNRNMKGEVETPVKDAGIGSVFYQMNRITQRRINAHHPLLKIAQDTQVWKQ